jgi:hypothetical protein
MKKHYRIADLIPLEARRAAAEAEYKKRRTAEGYCPLGIVLAELDALTDKEFPPHPGAPSSARFARVASVTVDADLHELASAAREFTNDWDEQRIPYARLAEALGVGDD